MSVINLSNLLRMFEKIVFALNFNSGIYLPFCADIAFGVHSRDQPSECNHFWQCFRWCFSQWRSPASLNASGLFTANLASKFYLVTGRRCPSTTLPRQSLFFSFCCSLRQNWLPLTYAVALLSANSETHLLRFQGSWLLTINITSN